MKLETQRSLKEEIRRIQGLLSKLNEQVEQLSKILDEQVDLPQKDDVNPPTPVNPYPLLEPKTDSKPLILVDIDEREQLTINSDAVKLLKSIDKEVYVIAIAGPYRSGKSYILNRFFHSQKGFQLGPNTQVPTTKHLSPSTGLH